MQCMILIVDMAPLGLAHRSRPMLCSRGVWVWHVSVLLLLVTIGLPNLQLAEL